MTTRLSDTLWVEKYRPRTIDDYIFSDDSLRTFTDRVLESKTIPHLLFTGPPGCGKTTLANILISELGVHQADVLSINASDENSVDVIRDRIKTFITTSSFGDYKVVHLEEADYISQAGQAVLRGFMEDFEDVARFILTCNYGHKILPAIKSRCQKYHFQSMDRNDITERLVVILANEGVEFNLDILDQYVSVCYPDVRDTIQTVQQNIKDGVLVKNTTDHGGDYKFGLLDLITQGDWSAARKLACANVLAEEWEDVYRFMYDNLDKSSKMKQNQQAWEEGILVIADHLYKHSICADPEINAAAMFIRLGQL